MSINHEKEFELVKKVTRYFLLSIIFQQPLPKGAVRKRSYGTLVKSSPPTKDRASSNPVHKHTNFIADKDPPHSYHVYVTI